MIKNVDNIIENYPEIYMSMSMTWGFARRLSDHSKTSEVWGDLVLSQDEVSKIGAHVQRADGSTSVQLMQLDLQENTE